MTTTKDLFTFAFLKKLSIPEFVSLSCYVVIMLLKVNSEDAISVGRLTT